MKIFAETERLLLREVIPADVDGFFELDSDPEVHKYLGNKPISEKEQALLTIELVRSQYVENGIGRWAVMDKETNAFAGWAGLKLVKERTNNHLNYYDVGYRLLRKFWGRGIASECAKIALNYGFDMLYLNEIYGAAHFENRASNRILKKSGLNFVETFDYFGVEHNWYKIDRQEWMSR